MPAFKDLTGKSFGKLTVLSRGPNTKSGLIAWLCQCECGNKKVVERGALQQGNVTSCGCNAPPRHGFTGKRLYRIWKSMKSRCDCDKHKSWEEYGGKGIRVCDEWARSFVAFKNWAVASGYSDDLTIDRKESDKGYEPGNCRWATPSQQLYNRKPWASKYHGVTLLRSGKWRASIYIQGKRYYLGVFPTDIEAALAYDAAAIPVADGFRRFNFPQEIAS